MQKNAPNKIKVHGVVYVRVAQLQQMLQQYETASNDVGKKLPELAKALLPAFQNAHKAAMGKQFPASLKLLNAIKTQVKEQVLDKVDDLIEQVNTMAGIEGMGGGA